MLGEVLKGQLVFVNTDTNLIGIPNSLDPCIITPLEIHAQTKLPYNYTWEDLLGRYVEVVTIDGKVKKLNR